MHACQRARHITILFESEAMADTDARRNDDCTSPERQQRLGQKEALEDERSAGQSTLIITCSKNDVVVGRILADNETPHGDEAGFDGALARNILRTQ
jgi:hypothetical protein